MENKEICKKISSMLSLYIDNRTTLEEKIYIENHLENCPVCYKKYIYLKSLIKDLKNSYKQVLELTKRKEKLKLFNIREHENFMQNISPYVDNELSPNECLEFRKYLVKSKNAQNELKKLYNIQKIMQTSFINTKKKNNTDFSKKTIHHLQQEKPSNYIFKLEHIFSKRYAKVAILLGLCFIAGYEIEEFYRYLNDKKPFSTQQIIKIPQKTNIKKQTNIP
jgi:hypothetical protein